MLLAITRKPTPSTLPQGWGEKARDLQQMNACTVSVNGSCVAGLAGHPSAITAVLMQRCQSDWYLPQLLPALGGTLLAYYFRNKDGDNVTKGDYINAARVVDHTPLKTPPAFKAQSKNISREMHAPCSHSQPAYLYLCVSGARPVLLP
jgi:hypothetical protein